MDITFFSKLKKYVYLIVTLGVAAVCLYAIFVQETEHIEYGFVPGLYAGLDCNSPLQLRLNSFATEKAYNEAVREDEPDPKNQPWEMTVAIEVPFSAYVEDQFGKKKIDKACTRLLVYSLDSFESELHSNLVKPVRIEWMKENVNAMVIPIENEQLVLDVIHIQSGWAASSRDTQTLRMYLDREPYREIAQHFGFPIQRNDLRVLLRGTEGWEITDSKPPVSGVSMQAITSPGIKAAADQHDAVIAIDKDSDGLYLVLHDRERTHKHELIITLWSALLGVALAVIVDQIAKLIKRIRP